MGIRPWPLRPGRLQGSGWWVGAWSFIISLTVTVLLHLSQGSRVGLAQVPVSKSIALPAPQIHPLPPSLAKWQVDQQAGDYFDQVQPVSVGYLVWGHFPISVYVALLKPSESAASFVGQQAQTWRNAMVSAIQEWTAYLPLTVVEQSEQADIVILRTAPPLQFDRPTTPSPDLTGNPAAKPGGLPLGRARSAETRFELYAQPTGSHESRPTLAHRVTIRLRPDQAAVYLKAAARHELGHALGIWGHSPLPTDALYPAQVANPGPISHRDINTLKRIYQQPTRLGWPLP